jgi:hypothetical protein
MKDGENTEILSFSLKVDQRAKVWYLIMLLGKEATLHRLGVKLRVVKRNTFVEDIVQLITTSF